MVKLPEKCIFNDIFTPRRACILVLKRYDIFALERVVLLEDDPIYFFQNLALFITLSQSLACTFFLIQYLCVGYRKLVMWYYLGLQNVTVP